MGKISTYIFMGALVSLWGFSFTAKAQLTMPDLTNSDVKAKVQAAFADAPDMLTVAECESGLREYGPDGNVLRGGSNQNYIGIFQISESGHAEAAKALGYDIYTVDGNIGYAKYLYDQEGIQPWISCAPKQPAAQPSTGPSLNQTPATATTAAVSLLKMPTAAASTSIADTLTLNLQLNMVGPQVLLLQQLLNKIGFPVASTGPGSPGNETTKFGSLTRQAVIKLQCSQGLVCSGSESTTGYGRVGPATRALILKLLQ